MLHMIKYLLLFVLFLSGPSCYSQDYFAYQAICTRVDDDVLAKDYKLALQLMDTVLYGYDFIFARHCIKALQICSCASDTTRAALWTDRCAAQCVPYWILKTNALTAATLQYDTSTFATMRYDSIYCVSKAALNTDLARQVEQLIERDQRYTRRVNDGFILLRYTLYYPRWLHNNKKQFKTITRIIDQYGYPGERLIGLPRYWEDSAANAKSIRFFGADIFNTEVWTMLVHYYSNPRKGINDKLLPYVQRGYMSAKQYADLNDMMADRGKTRYGRYLYYNTWHTDPDERNLDSINARRHALGLNDHATQQRNILAAREKRKNRQMNETVITE